MGADEQVLGGLLETYETAIAELNDWDDPATATLLESMRRLRERALSGSRKLSGFERGRD